MNADKILTHIILYFETFEQSTAEKFKNAFVITSLIIIILKNK